MKIGIDCDGTLTDMTAYICEYGRRWFKREPVNMDGKNTAEIFGCTEKEEFRFGLKYFFVYCKKWPPRESAADVTAKLNNSGHELYEITARKFAVDHSPLGWYSRHMHKKWLENNRFDFKETVYCSEHNACEDKLRECRKYGVDIMIDDSPDIAEYLAENGVKVLLFDTNYNWNVSGKNIIRVHDWNEAYKIIESV